MNARDLKSEGHPFIAMTPWSILTKSNSILLDLFFLFI